MPRVECSTSINAPVEVVYSIAKDNESFPEFMEDVLSVEIVEREESRIVSDWVGVVSSFGLKVRWRQEDFWDDNARECTFRQVEGDYDSMAGKWTFREEGGKTVFESDLDYEYNVPGLGPLVKKVVHSLVVKNIEGVLAAIRDRAEKQTTPGG